MSNHAKGGSTPRGRHRGNGRRSPDRDQRGRGAEQPQRQKRTGAADVIGKGGTLPRWVRDEMIRVTPKPKAAQALDALEQTATAFGQGQYRKALQYAEGAKALAPRDATVRELIGLSAYRLGKWEQTLRELRTYRRLSGDTAHLPVEMDAARALDRPKDVERAWAQLNERGGRPATLKEGRVVYGSYLLDCGRARDAWTVTNPGRLQGGPFEEDLRLWYVAARVAARLEDGATARKLLDAITQEDPGFPGLDELEKAVAAAGR